MEELKRYITIIEAQETAYRVKLPIALADAEPVLSKQSIDFHYNTLHKGYVDRAQSGDDFALAGVQLHNLWHEQMQPAQTGNSPFDASGALIEKQFGNFSDFKDAFAEEALSIQGSGWCYLSTTGTIKTIQNHKSVSDVAVIVDMWEHAYYMDYGPDKKKYLANIWKIVDWQIVNARLGNTQ